MKRLMWRCLILLPLTCCIAGCGDHAHSKSAGPDHHEDSHHEHEGADFDEQQGLHVGEAARELIGLKVESVTERSIRSRHQVNAQVFGATADGVLASALIPADLASVFQSGQEVEVMSEDGTPGGIGTLLRLDRLATGAIGQVEAILRIPAQGSGIGAFVEVAFFGREQNVIAVPHDAILESASGDFVYVQDDDRFVRQSVTLGARDADWVEVRSGLQTGERVVSHGVVDLWLIELRFTKGGGHSH